MGSSIHKLSVIVFILFISIFTLFSNWLVREVSAGCSGTVKCGALQYLCSTTGAWGCDPPGGDVACPGTCTQQCNVNANPQNRCTSLPQSSCETVTAPKDCSNGCNTSSETPCTWTDPCTWSVWWDGACDDGNCTATQRRQYRTVSPAGCTNSTKCIADSSCDAPSPVNGVCSNPDTHYTCTAGTSVNNVNGATTWTWNCNGSGGGTNASCTENKPVDGVCSSPDTHYTCTTGASVNNVSGATTWTWNCNGSGGGSNASCSENKPSPSTCSITSINPASTISGTSGQTVVTYTGSVSATAPAQNVRLWLERRDSLQVPGGAPSLSTSDAGGISEGLYSGKYYYEVARCAAGSGGSCNESQTIAAPPGEYYFHCDVAVDPNKCSGNPFCTYEGGSLDCTGWQSCSGSDNGPFDVNAIPNCKNLVGPSTILLGNSGTYTATFESLDGNLSGQIFYDSYTNIVNQGCAGTSCTFGGTWTPDAIGTYTVYCRAWNDAIAECRPPSLVDSPPRYSCQGPGYQMTVNVVNAGPWWQVKDGDVSTNGDLFSAVPSSGYYFDLKGPGGFPGIPAYGGTTNLTQANVSETGWLAASGYNASKIYNSAYFINAIPENTVINSLSSSIDGSAIASGGTDTDGIYWYEYDPAANGGADLTINTAASLGSRKVVVIVKGADVYLNGEISLTKSSGFFLLVAGATAGGAKGNIIVSPTVGGGTSANLEGIFVTDGQFRTGTTGASSDSKLWVRGSIAAYGGMSLQRDLGALNSTTPAELFEFAPDLDILFPRTLGTRSMSWQEVAP